MIAVEEQRARAEAYLAGIPGAAQSALAEALNRAITASRGESVAKIVERYAARTSDVRAMMTVTTATPERLEVSLVARSRALSLGYFPHTPAAAGTGGPGKPQLRAEVRRGSSKEVPSTFVARLNSGLRIMRRTGGKTSSGKDAIESVYTLPLAEMLGVPNIRKHVEEHAQATLDVRLAHEIDRRLQGAA